MPETISALRWDVGQAACCCTMPWHYTHSVIWAFYFRGAASTAAPCCLQTGGTLAASASGVRPSDTRARAHPACVLQACTLPAHPAASNPSHLSALPCPLSETAVVTSGTLARYPTPSGLMPCAEATLLYYDEVNVRPVCRVAACGVALVVRCKQPLAWHAARLTPSAEPNTPSRPLSLHLPSWAAPPRISIGPGAGSDSPTSHPPLCRWTRRRAPQPTSQPRRAGPRTVLDVQ